MNWSMAKIYNCCSNLSAKSMLFAFHFKMLCLFQTHFQDLVSCAFGENVVITAGVLVCDSWNKRTTALFLCWRETKCEKKKATCYLSLWLGFNALHAWIAAAVYQSLTHSTHKEANNIAHSARGSHFGAPQSKTSLYIQECKCPCTLFSYKAIYLMAGV